LKPNHWNEGVVMYESISVSRQTKEEMTWPK